MKHHRICRGAAVAAIFAAALLIAPLEPQPIEAQGHGGYCRVDWHVKSRLRRLTGTVMVECGDECVGVWCHSAPFGNWGVDSVFSERHDGAQFRGWKLIDGHRQWNSCTEQYYDGPWTNDGPRKQKADPDEAENAGGKTTESPLACAGSLPEVRTFTNAQLKLYELDFPGYDDYVTTLRYGTVNLRIDCSDAWTCSGETPWLTQTWIDSTGVSADAKYGVKSRFVSY